MARLKERDGVAGDRADRIAKIEGFELRAAMPHAAGNALKTFSSRGALLVRVTTEGGVSGWGETWAFPGAASALIRDVFASSVLGASIQSPKRLQGALLALVTPDRRGQAHMAISALDIAVWDAFGRANRLPIHALLGGAARDRVAAYASGPLMPAGPDRYAGFREAVEGYVAAGFRNVKIRVGQERRADEAAIRTAREILGPDRGLMIDLNESSSLHEALDLARRVEDAELVWIEEPMRHDDLVGYRRFAAQSRIPVAGGESFCGVQAFRDFVAAGALDILQPDLALCGGVTEAARISGLADAFDLPLLPHVWGAGVNFLASLQFAATLAPGRRAWRPPLFEVDVSENPLRTRIYDAALDADGMLAIPDGPGLGVEINLDALEKQVVSTWTIE